MFIKKVIAFFMTLASSLVCAQPEVPHDVLVYGATPAGIAASVSAAKMGMNVVLVEESNHVGGLTSGGLSYTDFRTLEAVQGIFGDFMKRVESYYKAKYGSNSQQVADCFHGAYYEPKVAKLIFEQMLSELPNISVLKNHRLKKVSSQENQVKSAVFLDLIKGKELISKASVFIDATYEGDLMASAGCDFRLGREAKEEFGERFAGKVFMEDGKFLAGSTGAGDKEIQNYNFRICMTNDTANTLMIKKPENYSRSNYLPVLEEIKTGRITKFNRQIVMIQTLPNGKADVNDRHFSPMSLALWGESHSWPEGTPDHRKALYQKHKDHALGLIYFVQNDSEIPSSIQNEARAWGLPRDEYVYNESFTPSLYVREGRRLVGEYIFKEQDTQQAVNSVRAPFHSSSVAVGDYGLNSHGTGKRSTFHPTIRDGQFSGASTNVPHQIPYGVMVPKSVNGLLVPVAISATHVGFSALRMEPIWASLGQAAGLAAALAVKQNVQVRDVKVADIQMYLHEEGAITIYFSDVLPGSRYFSAAQYFGQKGFFINVPSLDTIQFEDHLKFIRGQFTAAFQHHFIHPEKIVTKPLLALWLALSQYPASPQEEKHFLKLNRGDFLNELYQKSKSSK